MGKRFTDTAIWDKEWYRKLLPAEKVAFNYIKDRCDNVGVWCPDTELAEFIIGESVDWEAFLSKLNSNIVVLDNGKWWLSDFCDFQYGELTDTCKPHQSYIKLLKKHSLWKGYVKGIHPLPSRAKEKDKDKEKDKELEKDKDKEKNVAKIDKDTEVYNSIKGAFESKHGVFDNYPKEGKAIKDLIRKAKARAPDKHENFLQMMVVAFWRLKGEGEKFWKDQPFLPSALNSLWARVMEHARDDVVDEEFEEIVRGAFCR